VHVTAGALGPVEETGAQQVRRLHVFLTFYGPGSLRLGFAACRQVPWSDLSRGMGKPGDEQLATDESLRVFWRRWNELMEARA
jgi:p-cumate 2,3-dioxygenase subunit alpha